MNNNNKSSFRRALNTTLGMLSLTPFIFSNAFASNVCNVSNENSKLEFDAVLTTDYLKNTGGGIMDGDAFVSNLDLSAAYSSNNGFEAFGYIIADTGGGFSSKYSGDGQSVSNIDAPSGVRLLEAWIRKTGNNQKHVSTFGVINLNGIFDIQDYGGVFLNGSHGIGADISQNGPSLFPITGLGFVEEFHINETLALRGGIFDASPGDPDDEKAFTNFDISKKDGALLIAEIQKDFEKTTFKAGYWAYSNKIERIDGNGTAKNHGAYFQAATKLFEPENKPEQGLGAWVRFGFANDKTAQFDRYIGGGLSYTGPFESRPNDVLGFGIAHTHFGNDFIDANPQPKKSETNFELTYQFEIKPGLVIQPDFQYIKNPSGQFDDTKVFGFRLRIGKEAFK